MAPRRLASFHSIGSLPSPQQPIFGGAHQHVQRPSEPTDEAKLAPPADNTFLAIQRVQPPRPPVAGAERQPMVDYVVRLGVSQSGGVKPSRPLATTKTSGDAWSVDDKTLLDTDTSDSLASTEDEATWDEQSDTSTSSEVVSVDAFSFLDTSS